MLVKQKVIYFDEYVADRTGNTFCCISAASNPFA